MAKLKRKPTQPAPEPPPKPVPPPPVPPTVQPITRTTPFRSIGTLSPERVCTILADADSPMETECREIGTLQANALPLAQSFLESTYGKNARGRNSLGLFKDGVLMSFKTWTAAFVEWQRRMSDPTYKGGVYMPEDMSLERMIITFVCGPNCKPGDTRCGIDGSESYEECEAYLDKTVARLNRYFGTTGPGGSRPDQPPDNTGPGSSAYRDVTVAGSSKPLRLPVGLAFEQQLTPKGPNRSGRQLRWTGATQHETGNERVGTDAQMHATWQNNGTPGHPDGKIGVHFYIDDERAIQTIPIDEQGVHSGDWRNQEHVAVELCVNQDRNRAKAERNAVHLMAGLLTILGKSAAEAMYPHRTKPGAGCPVYLGQRWSAFEREVDDAIRTVKGDG
jgi:hypothetical protein